VVVAVVASEYMGKGLVGMAVWSVAMVTAPVVEAVVAALTADSVLPVRMAAVAVLYTVQVTLAQMALPVPCVLCGPDRQGVSHQLALVSHRGIFI